MASKIQDVFDKKIELSTLPISTILAAQAIQDATADGISLSVTRPLTAAEKESCVAASAAKLYDKKITAYAKTKQRDNETLAQTIARLESTEINKGATINKLKTQLSPAVDEYFLASDDTTSEDMQIILNAISYCIQQQQLYDQALEILGQKELIANERKEILFTNTHYIMYLYQQLIDLANDTTTIYWDRDANGNPSRPLITNANNAATYSTVYSLAQAKEIYETIIGCYKQNSNGQFLRADGTIISDAILQRPMQIITGVYVKGIDDKGNEVYYDRNGNAVPPAYDTEGHMTHDWIYPVVDPFAGFEDMVLEQGQVGLLTDIMTTQEQEDMYNLLKMYDTFLNNKYHIRWYRKNPDYSGATDKYAGHGWELLNDMTRSFNPVRTTTVSELVLHTDYTLKEPNDWYRCFYAGTRDNFNTEYSKIKVGENEDGTPQWRNVQGIVPDEVKAKPQQYFYFTNSGTYNWNNIKWVEKEYPTITLVAVIEHEKYQFLINPSLGGVVTCRNAKGAYVYVTGDTQFYPEPENPKTKELSDTICNKVSSWQYKDQEVPVYGKYVDGYDSEGNPTGRPEQLFSLDDVELWGKYTTTTFKAVVTYNGTYITSNEITFKNKSNVALADLVNDLNSRFKLQFVRPVLNNVHEEAPDDTFGTKHLADDNISEFFVFDERGHSVDNEDGIPYYQVPYYAILMMRDPDDEDAAYEIYQYDNKPEQQSEEITLLIGKFEAWQKYKTEYGKEPESTSASGYLSPTDKKKICAYCNLLDFEEVTLAKLKEACTVMTDDNPLGNYSIDWVTTDQNQSTREFGNRSMFNYCKRMTVEQVNETFFGTGNGIATSQRIFALQFKIKEDYSIANNNPTEKISLNINYNGQMFRIERELHFGPASTMGSEYSVSIIASHATDHTTNSHVLRVDEMHADGETGMCVYNLDAVVRHKGQQLTSEELNRMKVYWYLNSGLNTTEYTTASVNQMALTQSGTLTIRYKPEVGEEKPRPIVPPIITVRIDGLADYSLFYSQPFQVFCATGLQQSGPNPWRISVPDRVLFKSDGAEPLFHKADFVIEKVEYATSLSGGIEDLEKDTRTWVPLEFKEGAWQIQLAPYSTVEIPYKSNANNAFAEAGATYLDPFYKYWYTVDEGAPKMQKDAQNRETGYWSNSENQDFKVKIAAELNVGYLIVVHLRYRYVEGNQQQQTIQEWICEGQHTPDECLDNIEGEYTPTILANGQSPWKIYSRYRKDNYNGYALQTDDISDVAGESIASGCQEYFMNLGPDPYDAKLNLSHYLCITHNGARFTEEPADGSNAHGFATGETWGLDFYDSLVSGGTFTAQWEEKLRDAHTYLECQLQDGSWFTSSIVFERQVYCSSLVNSWSGSELILDEETNTVMTQHLVVGSKDSNNTFTGLMMGDWNGKYNDGSIDIPGLYGFRSGAQTFGLLTTGEAFFGAAGQGRIYINKRAGVISNYNMTAYMNLNPRKTDQIDNDTYDIRSKGYSPYFLYCEGDEGDVALSGPDTDWHDLENRSKTRDIFAVDPHRGIFMSGGIRSTWGNIGGWEISDAGLTKKKNKSKIYLGIGNETEAVDETFYLYMLLQYYIQPGQSSRSSAGYIGCQDEKFITYYRDKKGYDVNTVYPGMSYLDLLKIADEVCWNKWWQDGKNFANEHVQYLFKAYQTSVYDASNPQYQPNDDEYPEATKAAFEEALASNWLKPLRTINILCPLEAEVTTDGFITTTVYPLMTAGGAKYNIFDYESTIQKLYSKNRKGFKEDDSHAPYAIWTGNASSILDGTDPGTFSVTNDGYLFATSGTVGGWNLGLTKFYAAKDLTTYVRDENGQTIAGTYGGPITEQNADGNYLLELDVGTGTQAYHSPYIALLNRNILLECAQSGGARTYARMGFYYDESLNYEGRMQKRLDAAEVYHKRTMKKLEIKKEASETDAQFNERWNQLAASFDHEIKDIETDNTYPVCFTQNNKRYKYDIVMEAVEIEYWFSAEITIETFQTLLQDSITYHYPNTSNGLDYILYNEKTTGKIYLLVDDWDAGVEKYFKKEIGLLTQEEYDAWLEDETKPNDQVQQIAADKYFYQVMATRTENQPKLDNNYYVPVYQYRAVKYKSTDPQVAEASDASPEQCGWTEDESGHYLAKVHYTDKNSNNVLTEYTMYRQVDIENLGSDAIGIPRLTVGGYNIVIDGYDVDNQGSIKIGQCIWHEGQNDETVYPAIELLGTGVIRLHHDNIILDGKNREVQIGTKAENGVVSIVGFCIGSEDVNMIEVGYSGGPTIFNDRSTDSEDYSTADPDNPGGSQTDVTYWHEEDPEHYSVGYGLTLTYDVPYQKHDYKLGIDGDFLKFTRYLANEQGDARFTDKGLVMVSGTVTQDNLGENGATRILDDPYDKTILLPASNLIVNQQNNQAAIAETAKAGLLYRWDLIGDWVSTGTVFASKGIFGPAGEVASLQYVNEKLADLARQIANLLGRINGNIADLRRIIKAIAGGEEGIKQILGEAISGDGQTYLDGDGQSHTVSAGNLLEKIAGLLTDVAALQKATSEDTLGKTFSKIGHTHSFTPDGSVSVSISGDAENGYSVSSASFTGSAGTTDGDSAPS